MKEKIFKSDFFCSYYYGAYVENFTVMDIKERILTANINVDDYEILDNNIFLDRKDEFNIVIGHKDDDKLIRLVHNLIVKDIL